MQTDSAAVLDVVIEEMEAAPSISPALKSVIENTPQPLSEKPMSIEEMKTKIRELKGQFLEAHYARRRSEAEEYRRECDKLMDQVSEKLGFSPFGCS